MNYIRIISLCICGALCLLVTSCGNSGGQNHSSTINISTSIEPLAELVRTIGDSLVQVSALLPEGYSAESYEPSMNDLKKISSADIYFAIGDLGFETTRLDRLKKMNPKVKFVRLSDNLCHEHGTPTRDPHIWTSTRGIESLAHSITKSLSQIDTINSKLYYKRFNDFHNRVDSIRTSIKKDIWDSGVKGFVIYHPSLSDYAEEFSLVQLCIEHQGKEPNPQQLSDLINKAKQLNVKVVFVQKEFNSRLSNTIAKEIGANIFEINPLGKHPIQEIEKISNDLVSSTTK